MDLRTYLAVLGKSWLLIAIVTLLGAGVGATAYVLTPPVYATTVDFYVSTPQAAGTSAQSGGQFAESRVSSYIILLSSEQLAQRVVESTGVALTPRELAGKVSASTELNTVIVTATVSDQSPGRSLVIAQGVADGFPELVDELDNQGRTNPIVVIHVVSGPAQELTPVSPDRKRYLGLGVLGGLALGVIIALLREVLDTSVRSVEVAQRIVAAPMLGTIGYDPDTKRSPLIVGAEASTTRAESYRQLRTNLQFISAARSVDVILVTSSLPLEGKTTTSVNLALTFVEFGERVLLIEGDLRRPKVAEYLNLEQGVGLTNVLAGQAELDEVIQPWGTDGLYVLGSGTIPPNPSELLGSPRMAEIVDSLKDRYDKIVVDAPPVLPVTDAVVATALAEAVVVIIRHGRTTRAQLTTASQSLANVDAPVVGAVFNMKKQGRRERVTYGSNVHYGPGKGSSVQRREATPTDQPVRGGDQPVRDSSGSRESDVVSRPAPEHVSARHQPDA